MSDKIGPLFYGSDQGGEVFLGYSMGQASQTISEQMTNLIDSEVKRIVQEAHEKAHALLTEHIDALHRIAQGLLEYETLTGDEIKTLVNGEEIKRTNPNAVKPPPTKSSLPGSRKKPSDDEQQPAA
jgi:cell division protease FtsH